MEKTWKPVVAGILDIISGVCSLLGVIIMIIAIVAVGSLPFLPQFYPGTFTPLVPSFMSILVIIAIVLAVLAIVPLVGGIYALQRKRWGLALAGSIIAILGSMPLGIAATIFVALGKDEFE